LGKASGTRFKETRWAVTAGAVRAAGIEKRVLRQLDASDH
jgi:hypothetical protein